MYDVCCIKRNPIANIVPVLGRVPQHEDVRLSRVMSSLTCNLGAKWRRVINLTSRLFIPGTELRFPVNGKLEGAQSGQFIRVLNSKAQSDI
jgi:hypothetical protein